MMHIIVTRDEVINNCLIEYPTINVCVLFVSHDCNNYVLEVVI